MKYSRYIVILLLLATTAWVNAQQTQQLIAAVNKNFKRVKDYSADATINFEIPTVVIKPITGKVFYKTPNKFRVRTNGIMFLPKQNPYYALMFLADSSAYTSVPMGNEKIGVTDCNVVSVVPLKESDVIFAKFWIDAQKSRIIRSQITTRSNGVIQVDNTYGTNSTYPLPDKMLFTVDMTKFKVPKAISVDINSKTDKGAGYNQKGTGYITISFSGYKVNQNLPDAVFTEEDK